MHLHATYKLAEYFTRWQKSMCGILWQHLVSNQIKFHSCGKIMIVWITLIDCNRNPIKLSHKYLQDTREVKHIKMTFTLCPIKTKCDYNLSVHKVQLSVTHWQPLWIYFMFNTDFFRPVRSWKLISCITSLIWKSGF